MNGESSVNLWQACFERVDYDLDHTVFSYIPNTAETAFYGLVEDRDAYTSRAISIRGPRKSIGKIGFAPFKKDQE